MEPTITDEHRWLQQLVGEWTYESEAVMDPNEPPYKQIGTETVRGLGGCWVLMEGAAEMTDGTPMGTMITLGYDPVKGKFVGTFIASVMTHLWEYVGERDPESGVLHLFNLGPSMSDPQTMAEYRDTIEVLDADHRTLSSHVKGKDGEWVWFMTARYTRVPAAEC